MRIPFPLPNQPSTTWFSASKLIRANEMLLQAISMNSLENALRSHFRTWSVQARVPRDRRCTCSGQNSRTMAVIVHFSRNYAYAIFIRSAVIFACRH